MKPAKQEARLHPRITERVRHVEAAKREELYRTLDSLLQRVGDTCAKVGLHCASRLNEQRAVLAKIAAADEIDTDALVEFATKVAQDAGAVMLIVNSLIAGWGAPPADGAPTLDAQPVPHRHA